MAKGGISKGKKAAPSIHSRAARRATSPGIDTDKSLKDVKPPPKSLNERPAVLAAHHNAGVSKKKRSRKSVMSAKARRRYEKGVDRAEAILDRTAKKIDKSKGQEKAIKSRRKPWEEINQGIIPPSGGSSVAPGQGDENDDDDDEDGAGAGNAGTDDEMAAVDSAEAPATQDAVPNDEDEIL